jgi:hypothetical protein
MNQDMKGSAPAIAGVRCVLVRPARAGQKLPVVLYGTAADRQVELGVG